MEGKAKSGTFVETGLLQNDELYKYLLKTSVYPHEAQLLKEIRAVTSTHPWAIFGTSPDSGSFIGFILKLINAKKTIEVGVFTGYSLLLTALTIPEDGKILAIDPNRSSYEIGLPIIEKAGVKHKINYMEAEALPVLDELLQDINNHETFDFAYVDADKPNYANYHERLLKLIKPGGIVIYDNTLWGGTVAINDGDCVPEMRKEGWLSTVKLNKFLAADSRIHICQIPLGDGMTICRRL